MVVDLVSDVLLIGVCFLLAFAPTVPSHDGCQDQVFDNVFITNKYLKQPYLMYNDTTPVQNIVVGRMLSSKTPETFCAFDVMRMAVMYKRYSTGGLEVLTFGIVCHRKQNVIFSNILDAKSYLNKSNFIGFMYIVDCGIDVHNVRNLLEITRFYVADFERVSYNSNYSSIVYENNEMFKCSGLDTLFGLYINNVYPVNEFLRDLHLCKTSYPNMAIVHVSLHPDEIYDIDLPKFINVLYPNIQSVSIVRTGLVNIPKFKFTDNDVVLPYGLYLPNHNQQTYEIYLDFPRNVFKKTLELSGNKISLIPNNVFEGQIHMLGLDKNEISSIAEAAFWKVKGLRVLRLNGNNISRLPELLLFNQNSLQYLDLSKNSIGKLTLELFLYTPYIRFIDLSYNKLTLLPDGLFKYNKYLNTLAMDYNLIKYVPDNLLPTSDSALKELSIRGNQLFSLPILIFYSRHIKQIRLSNNNISWEGLFRTLLSVDLPKFIKEIGRIYAVRHYYINYIYLDLSNNYIESISVSNITMDVKLIFQSILTHYDIALSGNPLVCDCSSMPFIHMVNEFIATHQLEDDVPLKRKWICAKPRELKNTRVFDLALVLDRLYCPSSDVHCPVACVCFRRLVSSAIIIDCSKKELLSMPITVPSTELEMRMPENNITSIPLLDYLGNVVYLDVKRNHLRTINRLVFLSMTNLTYFDVSYNLFTSLPDTMSTLHLLTLRLSNNPYRCDCNTRWLKHWLFKKSNIVPDEFETSCSTEDRKGRRMMLVDESEFVCRPMQREYVTMWVYITIPISLFLCVIIIFVITCRHSVKILLFYHFGIDCSRTIRTRSYKYDVFIIYPQNLNDFVETHLEPLIKRYDVQSILMWRDMHAGFSIGNNIRHFSKNSKKILFIIDWEDDEDMKQSWDMCYDHVENARMVLLSKSRNLKEIDNLQIRALAKRGQCIMYQKRLFSQRLVYSLSLKVKPQSEPDREDLLGLECVVVHREMLVYIVYEEEDRDLVETEMFTKLNNLNISYTHEEDFCPGQPRLANIQSAIERTDHTLMFLSRENMDDEDLHCVFRLTHEKSLRENTNYLIVVTRGQLDISLLENESLRSYLKSRVCLDIDNISEARLCKALQMVSLEE